MPRRNKNTGMRYKDMVVTGKDEKSLFCRNQKTGKFMRIRIPQLKKFVKNAPMLDTSRAKVNSQTHYTL